MLSKAQISLITSLQHKKFRKQHQLFIVEGIKSVFEFINSTYEVEAVFYTADSLAKMGKISQNIKLQELTEQEFAKISALTNPQGILALIKMPETQYPDKKIFTGKHTLLLDDVQDPGNLGTIIRTAEWFGFTHLICSLGTVDVYNPKVVQATMGSLSRIEVHYTSLEEFISEVKLPVFGALLNGENIYTCDWQNEGLIILGNEGNGISPAIQELVNTAVTIPRIGQAESLNVAVATTVFCNEIARRRFI